MCSAFLAAWRVFESRFPSAFCNQEEDAIKRARTVCMNTSYEVLVLYLLKPWLYLSSLSLGCCRFMFRHLDADLTTMLEMKVPPAPLECVTAFAAAVVKFEKQAGDWLDSGQGAR